jgi:hypothetical protein
MKFLAIAAVSALALSGAFVGEAHAQKQGWSRTVTNPGGNQPSGQQTRTRTDKGWNTTVQNPGGKQPPGQQPSRMR